MLRKKLSYQYLSIIVWVILYYPLSVIPLFAQQSISMDEAVAIALANHPIARNVVLAEQKDALMQKQAVELAPVQARYLQHNSVAINRIWSVTQNFGIIPEHIRRSKYYKTVASAHQAERVLALDELTWQVKLAYCDVVYYRKRLNIMQEHNHYFEALIDAAEIHLATDSITELTKVSTGTRYAAYQSSMYIAEEELKRAETRLRQLMFLPDGEMMALQPELELYQIHPDKTLDARFDPVKHQAMDEAQLKTAESAAALERSKLFPAIHAGYFNQHIEGMGNYQGWMAGLSVPLWIQPQRARIRQAEIDLEMKANETKYGQFTNQQHIETLKSLLNEYFVQISFCKENVLVEAELILTGIEKNFSIGHITDYAEALTKVHHAVSAKLNHLEYISLYNKAALELEYYTQ